MNFGQYSDDLIRIRVENIHIGRVNEEIVKKLEKILKDNKISRQDWIQQQSIEEFGIKITKENIFEFDRLIQANYYTDRGDWLLDKIRHFLKREKK